MQMNGVIMVLASITLTMAMSFATVLRRHRRIQRADPSRRKILDMEKIISGGFGRSLFFLTRRVRALNTTMTAQDRRK